MARLAEDFDAHGQNHRETPDEKQMWELFAVIEQR
jgi:hypothetical protein